MVNLAWRSRIGRRGRIGRGRIKISIHYNTFRKWKKTQTQWNLHPNYILLLLLQKEEEVLSSKLKKRILKINCSEFVLWFALFCVQSCLNLKYVCVTQKKICMQGIKRMIFHDNNLCSLKGKSGVLPSLFWAFTYVSTIVA